ncbi:MAG TPA: lytic murein transglycosylase, partial [Pseudomonas sp.]|nr:lytic murein transglycosylase [Pseudomonas sp.]
MYYTFVPVLLLRTLVAASAMSLVVACAAEPLAQSSLVGNAAAPSGQRSDNAVVDAPAEATHLSFSQWREQFRAEALAAGISATTFDRAFAGVQPDPAVIEADRSQP